MKKSIFRGGFVEKKLPLESRSIYISRGVFHKRTAPGNRISRDKYLYRELSLEESDYQDSCVKRTASEMYL